MSPTRSSSQVLDRLVEATNAHDVEALEDCFAADYELTDPVHPNRSFTGAAQVRKNWATMFQAVPDIRLDVHDQAVTDGGFWFEAAQVGTRRDGGQVDNRMVFIARVRDGRVGAAHIYVAPVEPGGPDINAVFAAIAGAGGPDGPVDAS